MIPSIEEETDYSGVILFSLMVSVVVAPWGQKIRAANKPPPNGKSAIGEPERGLLPFTLQCGVAGSLIAQTSSKLPKPTTMEEIMTRITGLKNNNAKIAAAAIRAEAAIIVADARLGSIPSFGGGSFRVKAGEISRAYGVPFDWALRVLCRRISAHFPRPPQTENGDWEWWWDGSWWSMPGYVGRAVAACVGER